MACSFRVCCDPSTGDSRHPVRYVARKDDIWRCTTSLFRRCQNVKNIALPYIFQLPAGTGTNSPGSRRNQYVGKVVGKCRTYAPTLVRRPAVRQVSRTHGWHLDAGWQWEAGKYEASCTRLGPKCQGKTERIVCPNMTPVLMDTFASTSRTLA